MGCNTDNTDCAPCKDCPPSVPPVLPRCQDVILPDGVYPNASIVVVQGCIVQIEAGEAMAYQPTTCCPTSGGGGGEDGLMGPPGPPGAAATITVGTVTAVGPADPPTIVNSGTSSNAIFNFEIPSGEPGADGASSSGIDKSVGGWDIENGVIKELPLDFPPICTALFGGTDVLGLNLNVVKDPTSGYLTITVDGDAFYNSLMSAIALLQADIDAVSAGTIWGGLTGDLEDQTDLWGQLQVRPRWTYANSAPASPSLGQRWWNKSTNVEYVWIDDGVNPPSWLPV